MTLRKFWSEDGKFPIASIVYTLSGHENDVANALQLLTFWTEKALKNPTRILSWIMDFEMMWNVTLL